MTILGISFDSTTHGAPHAHDAGLVILSFLVAAFASYSALDMAERMRAAEGRARDFWLTLSGVMLGAGIWSMHFVGMTAFNAPMDHGYGVDLTLLSGLIAILAVVSGLWLLGPKPTFTRLCLSGLVVGAGVAVMHYVGMSALGAPGEIVYRPGLFGLSILIALTAATTALWLAVTVRKTWQRVIAAVVMAVAICGMHYTAMSGTVFVHAVVPHAAGALMSKSLLADIVVVGIAGLIAAGLIMAFLDRRMDSRNQREAARLREVNAALESASREAEAAARAKSQFLATMSHEIRTPMNGVLGMLEAVLHSDLDAVQRDEIATARDAASSLLRILNDILDYSKLEAGQLVIEALSFSPRQVAQDVLSVMDTSTARKNLRIDLDIDPALPGWIVGDAMRLRQILTNLVGNAVKFTPAGVVTIAMHWTGPASDRHVRVEVRDTGIGIDAATRSRLFMRFSQADASTTRRFGGTGLGLAICRELIHRMGGEIGVDSEPGSGSTFWFDLPTREGQEPQSSDAATLAGPDTSAPLDILVAEDNPVNQKVLRALMADLPHRLTFVSDGRQAVNILQAQAFDMVLMDISMPVMDGPTAARAIRVLGGPAAATPIIALTANAMAGDRETYLAAGMNDYVSKPIDIHALLAAIDRQRPPGKPGRRLPPAPAAVQAARPEIADAALGDISADLDALLADIPGARAA